MIIIRHREIKWLLIEIKLLKLLLFKMTILSLKDFMEKSNLRNDTMVESQLENVFIYLINPRASEYNQIKDLQLLIMVVWVELIGCVSTKNITNFFTSTASEALDKFLLTNYLNQLYIIIIKYKIYIQNYLDQNARIFSI